MTGITLTVAEARGGLPVLGHVVSLLRNPGTFLLSLPEQGDVVRIRLGPSRAYVVCNAELTHQVLVNDRIFDKGGAFVERVREFVGDNVAMCPRAEHRRLRRIMQPAFASKRLADYAEIMNDETAEAIGSWRHGEVLDVYAGMQAISTRIAARTMFAAPVSRALIEGASSALTQILIAAGRRVLIPAPLDRIPTPGKLRYDRARRDIRRITDQLIADYRAAGVDHHDLMSMLLRPDDNGNTLSPEEISDQVVGLFLAAMETVASTLGWTLCVLALRPDVQERFHQEIDTVLQGRRPGLEDLPALPYTNAVALESLRMYPPAWLLTRETTTDIQLGGVAIPAHSTIIYSPFLLGRRRDLFDDPDLFDPDRWIGPAELTHRGAFVPFGGGPRKCIGDTFGMVELAVVLAAVGARWRVEPVNTRIRPLKRMSLLSTPRKLKVRLVSRNSANS